MGETEGDQGEKYEENRRNYDRTNLVQLKMFFVKKT